MYTSFFAELWYFPQSVTATLVFLYSGHIIHINISTSVGGEPTNAACAPSTATSDVLNHYAAFVGSPPTEVEIFIWIMSPLYKKSLDICFVAWPSGSLPSLYKLYPWGQKWPHPRGQMFYIGLCRENVKKSSCLKPQCLEPWYLVWSVT